MKDELGINAKGRKVVEQEGVFHLREEANTCNAVFAIKNSNIEPENSYLWNN